MFLIASCVEDDSDVADTGIDRVVRVLVET